MMKVLSNTIRIYFSVVILAILCILSCSSFAYSQGEYDEDEFLLDEEQLKKYLNLKMQQKGQKIPRLYHGDFYYIYDGISGDALSLRQLQDNARKEGVHLPKNLKDDELYCWFVHQHRNDYHNFPSSLNFLRIDENFLSRYGIEWEEHGIFIFILEVPKENMMIGSYIPLYYVDESSQLLGDEEGVQGISLHLLISTNKFKKIKMINRYLDDNELWREDVITYYQCQ